MIPVIALAGLAAVVAVTVEICRRAAKEKRWRDEHKLLGFYSHYGKPPEGCLVYSAGPMVQGHINGNVRFQWTPSSAIGFAQLIDIAAHDILKRIPPEERALQPGSDFATNCGERVRTGPNCGGCGRELPEEQKP